MKRKEEAETPSFTQQDLVEITPVRDRPRLPLLPCEKSCNRYCVLMKNVHQKNRHGVDCYWK